MPNPRVSAFGLVCFVILSKLLGGGWSLGPLTQISWLAKAPVRPLQGLGEHGNRFPAPCAI